MLKKMRYQFILVTMACISFIFILILTIINISMTLSSRNQGYGLLYRIANMPEPGKRQRDYDGPRNYEKQPSSPNESRGKTNGLPPDSPVGGFDALRSFSVSYDLNGNIQTIHYNEASGFNEENIRSLADEIMNRKQSNDRGVSSKYLYLIRESPENIQVYFLDYSLEKSMSLRLFWTCLFIGLIGILFIFILVIFLSKWIIKPVQTAFDKQKQFIADASHELKTPLTIIATNAEVLAGNIGENKWLGHIMTQTVRMSILMKNLLELAKLDSCARSILFTTFDLSKSVQTTALSFESLAFEHKKTYEMDINENLTAHGDEESIRQLTVILLDNAFKYSEEKGIITIRLKSHGDKKVLTIENTGKGIPKDEQKRIFERFYRSDVSRSRESGGYGLGLSIAASIVQMHKGSIVVKSDEKSYTRLIVTLP